MTDKYKNRYRIAAARASWWNYGWAGAYFITVCTQGKAHFFGEIAGGKMKLSPVGVLADVFWHEIPGHAPSIELGAFVVMPNHIHGILVLPTDAVSAPLAEPLQAMPPQTAVLPPCGIKNQRMAAISPRANTVSALIRSYKSAVTRHANRLELAFGWQARFHDHIIRNDAEYQHINDYIENNPSNWEQDGFFYTGG